MIGRCNVTVKQFWELTEAETIGIIAGYQITESYDSEKYRNIYMAIAAQGGNKKPADKLWPLPTDHIGDDITPKERFERNRKAIIEAQEKGII